MANELQGEIVVAKIDATSNRVTKERFNVKFYPLIKFFRKGEMYNYKHLEGTSTSDLLTFVRSGWSEVTPEIVPKPVTFVETCLRWLNVHKDFAFKRLDLAKRDIAKVWCVWSSGYTLYTYVNGIM